MSQDKEVEKAFRNVELLAAKTYTATGVVLIAIYFFQGTFYVVLGETTGEQPLLDSRFPDVSAKGRGYLVSSYGDGTMTWPQLRKVSIWQTAAAMQSELEARGVKASDGDDEAEVHVVTGKPITRDPLEAARMGGEDAKSVRKTAIVTPSPTRSLQRKRKTTTHPRGHPRRKKTTTTRTRRTKMTRKARPRATGGSTSY